MFRNKFTKTLSILTLAAMLAQACPFAASAMDTAISDEAAVESSTMPEDYVPYEAELQSDVPRKLIYNKYTFGATVGEDTTVGKMTYYDSTGGSNEGLVEVNPDEYDGTSWISPFNYDSVGIHTELDGTPCYFTTKYIRNSGKGSVSPGYIYICMGDDVTTEDKSFIVEVETYGSTNSNLTLRYVISNEKKYKTSAKARVNDGQWQTLTYEINDAYFNGSASTGLANGAADFRLEAGSADTYIKSVAVYNTKDYKALYNAMEMLELPVDVSAVEDNFTLPVLSGFDIEWTSGDEEAVYINGDTAVIMPDYTEKAGTVTARIIRDGYYVEKDFELTLKALEKNAIEFSSPEIVEANGSGAVGIDIRNGRNYSGKITLFALAVDKTSGRIVSIGMDSFVGGTAAEARLDAAVPLGASLELKYCLLDSNGASLKNNPPAKPGNLRYSASFDSMELMWDKAYDDYDFVKRYEVKKDGELIAETEDVLTAPVSELTPGESCSFEIIAYDHMDEASEPAVIDIVFPGHAKIDMGDTENAQGVTFLLNENIGGSDSYTEEAEVGGIKCRKNVDRKVINEKSRTWLYFKTDKELISSEDRNIVFEITYLDRGSKSLVLQYNAADGSAAKTKTLVPALGNTDEWKTITVSVDDAEFAELSALSRCDFRLGSDQAGGEVYIAKVRVMSAY